MVVGRFLHAGPALHRAQAAPEHAPQLLTVGTHPSALSLAPIPRLCSARVATPVALPPMSRPLVIASVPQRSHLCAHTLELSHHSLMLCGVTSVLSLLALPPLLPQLGMPRQELDDEALKQPASLAKLQLPKACCAGRHLVLPVCTLSHVGRVCWHPSLRCMDTWMPPVQLTTPTPTYDAPHVPFTRLQLLLRICVA
jgi:hypothetical protein